VERTEIEDEDASLKSEALVSAGATLLGEEETEEDEGDLNEIELEEDILWTDPRVDSPSETLKASSATAVSPEEVEIDGGKSKPVEGFSPDMTPEQIAEAARGGAVFDAPREPSPFKSVKTKERFSLEMTPEQIAAVARGEPMLVDPVEPELMTPEEPTPVIPEDPEPVTPEDIEEGFSVDMTPAQIAALARMRQQADSVVGADTASYLDTVVMWGEHQLNE